MCRERRCRMKCREKWEQIAAETVGEDLESCEQSLLDLVNSAVAEFYRGSGSTGLSLADYPVRSSIQR